MRVPSEEATALSRMADAAAAAAAFTVEGLRDEPTRPSQQAQRAELAKRAQQASDAVLRGESDRGGVPQPDRRSYSRLASILCLSAALYLATMHHMSVLMQLCFFASCEVDFQHEERDALQKLVRVIADTSKRRSVSVLLDTQVVGYGRWR